MSTSTKADEKDKWFDFKTVKEQSDVIAVLTHYGLMEELEQRSNELVGWCPLGTKTHGKKDSFNFNIKKKSFKCFACKQHGSTLDFVSKYQTLHLREACEVLVMINDNTAPPAPLSQNHSEKVPIPTKELDSEASEQTDGEQPELAEIEGSASRSPSVDDPTTPFKGMKRPDKKSVNYLLSFEEALKQVTSGQTPADQFMVLDKVTVFGIMDQIDKFMSKK